MRVVTRTRTAATAVCAAVVVAVTGGAGSTETLVERGAYLVTTVAACGNCHTPRDASGKPMANMTLAGGFEYDDGPIGHVVARNITPDPETGIGKWSLADITELLKSGLTPDGDSVGSGMADVVDGTGKLTDADRQAIAVYIKSLPPRRATGK